MDSESKRERNNVRVTAWKRAHPERTKRSRHEYEQRNKEKIAARKRKYHREHRAECYARKVRWQKANPEKYRAMLRRQYAKAKARGYHRKYRLRAQVQYLLTGSRARAKKRGLPHTLTKNDIVIPEVCPVLGIKIRKGDNLTKTGHSPSLDRMDNSKGYTPENVRVISLRANRLKSDATIEEMRRVLHYMENGI